MAEKEYIEREKLNDMIEDFCVNETFYDALQTIPAADVAPVRHGHWINENFYTHCSACGKMAIYDKYGQEFESNFCPNCGAKMDGGEQGNDT